MKRIVQYKYSLILGILSLGYLLFHWFVFKHSTLEAYPYLHQDLWRRLHDSLFYLGQSSDVYFHPPVPSLLYAVAIRFQAYWIMVLTNSLLFIAAFVGIYKVSRELGVTAKASLVAALLFYFNFYNIRYSTYYGLVDLWCMALVVIAVYVFLRMRRKPSLLKAFILGSTLGIAGLVQYAGVYVAPLLVLFSFISRPKQFWAKQSIIRWLVVAGTAVLIFGSFFIYRAVAYGSPTYSKIDHFMYFKFHLDDLTFYAWQHVVYFTIPVIVLAVVGLVAVWKQSARRRLIAGLALFIPFPLFFVLNYTWEDQRFIVYWVLPIYVLAALGAQLLVRLMKPIPGRYYLASALFIIILVMSNLHNQGEQQLILTPTVSFKQNIEQQNDRKIISYKRRSPSDAFTPYYLYMLNYADKLNSDAELHYFQVTVNPQIVKRLTDHLQPSDSVALRLKDEVFVRSVQSSYYLKHEVPFNFYFNHEYFKYTYIITDTPVDFPGYTMIDRSGQLMLYRQDTYVVGNAAGTPR